MNPQFEALQTAIMEGDLGGTKQAVQATLDGGIAPGSILTEGMISVMGEAGRLFEEGEYFVPEMLIAARAMQSDLGLLKPYLARSEIKAIGKVDIGIVKDDLHEIGKNLVALMLGGAGFEVKDLGVDFAPENFVEAVHAVDDGRFRSAGTGPRVTDLPRWTLHPAHPALWQHGQGAR